MSRRHGRHGRSHRPREPAFEAWIPELDAYVLFRSRREYRTAARNGGLGDFIDDMISGRIRVSPAGIVADRQDVAAAIAGGRPIDGGGAVVPGSGAQQFQRVLETLNNQQRSIDALVQITQGIGRMFLEDRGADGVDGVDGANNAGEQAPP